MPDAHLELQKLLTARKRSQPLGLTYPIPSYSRPGTTVTVLAFLILWLQLHMCLESRLFFSLDLEEEPVMFLVLL